MTVTPFKIVGPAILGSLIAAGVTMIIVEATLGEPLPRSAGSDRVAWEAATDKSFYAKAREAGTPVVMNPFRRHIPATYVPKEQ